MFSAAVDGTDSKRIDYTEEPVVQATETDDVSRTNHPDAYVGARFGKLEEGLKHANAKLYNPRGRLQGASMNEDSFR